MKILVIDDSRQDRAALQAFLSNTGHDVVLADDGRNGVAAFARSDPDLVLLDLHMSDIGGYETARMIRRAGDQWVPIVMLTEDDDRGAIAAAAGTEGYDVITKTCAPEVLEAKMHTMARVAQMRRQIINRGKRLDEATAALEKMADTDKLTGCANRRKLEHKLDEEVRRGARNAKSLATVVVEIDHLKALNDGQGRAAGDACLRQVATVLRAQLLRPADMLARHGGPSFCVVLPETDAQGAAQVAERMRVQVAALTVTLPRQTTCVTASFGIAAACPTTHASPEAWLHSAETALFAAQQKGRNAIHCEHIFLA
jgi:diguanylate cyclase (GGDEF)-like protein